MTFSNPSVFQWPPHIISSAWKELSHIFTIGSLGILHNREANILSKFWITKFFLSKNLTIKSTFDCNNFIYFFIKMINQNFAFDITNITTFNMHETSLSLTSPENRRKTNIANTNKTTTIWMKHPIYRTDNVLKPLTSTFRRFPRKWPRLPFSGTRIFPKSVPFLLARNV